MEDSQRDFSVIELNRNRDKRIKKYMGKRFVLFLLPLLLDGCSFAPHYNRPPLPTAEYYPRQTDELLHTNVKEIAWQEFFGDPILREIIDLALTNNRDLRTAMYRMEEAWAVYGIQRSDLFPHVDAVSENIRGRIPGSILSEIIPDSPSKILSAYLLALRVSSWELDFWGRIRNLKDAALEEFLSSGEAERAICISLIDQVANAYLIGCELNELIEITTNTAASRKASYDLMNRRYEEGSSSKYELVQSETLFKQAEVDLTTLERMRELNWNALVRLVGAPVAPDNRLLSEIECTFVQEISSGLPSDLLCNRPDILAAEHRLKAAHFSIGAARAAFFPRISLTAFLGTASSELKGLFGHNNFFWAFSPDASLPIFDGGSNISNLYLAKAQRNVVVTEYERTIQDAFREVADALSERTWYGEQIVFQNEALGAETERTRLARLRYNQGSSSFLEVLDAEREKFAVEQDLVKSRRAFLSSTVNLYSALGGGIGCR